MYRQILDAVNHGIVILSSDYKVLDWNRWMEIHSGISRDIILNTSIFNHYPNLSYPGFTRSCKSVLKFGNYIFFSQKLHNYLFPFKTIGSYSVQHEMMQQSCTIVPMREEDGSICKVIITVQDVTESVYLENELRIMSQRDSLTGIHNRRYFDVRFNEEFSRSKRSGQDLSLLMMDIDNFKLVNDRYGHQYGDLVLKEIATTCNSITRSCDIFARYGGEEFCILLPDSGLSGAEIFAERVRASIELMKVSYNEEIDIQVTVSIGIAVYNPKVGRAEQLLDGADNAMYQSKNNGKNQVTSFKY